MWDGIRENPEAQDWLESEWISLCDVLIDTMPGFTGDDDDSIGTVDPHEFAEHFVDHMVDGVLAGRVLELFHEYEPTSVEWTLFMGKNPDWERGVYVSRMPSGFEEWVDELADYFKEQTSSAFTKDEIVGMVLEDDDTRKFMERTWITLCDEWCEVMEAPSGED